MDSSHKSGDEIKSWNPSCSAFQNYKFIDKQQSGDRTGFHSPRAVPSIVVKLTRDCIQTFKSCNISFSYSKDLDPKQYLTHPSVPFSNEGLDNENSDLILAVDDVLVNEHANVRFIVKEFLGQGTFGQVVKCWIKEIDSFVAVKVIKNQPEYKNQAMMEISILHSLNTKYDPGDNNHIVRMLDYFIYKEHLCIVFEMLGLSLLQLLIMKKYDGLSLNLVRHFTKQILMALAVVNGANIIHCDLKPENILLTTCFELGELKVIDFGCACNEDQTIYTYIQTRSYRSPEVILGHKYTSAIDMWSVGCIAAELFLGVPLFPAESEYDLLQRMMKVLRESPPDHILRNAKKTHRFFRLAKTSHDSAKARRHFSVYEFRTLDDFEKEEKKRVPLGKHIFPEDWDLEKIIMNYRMRKGLTPEELEGELQGRAEFTEFIKGLVTFDPQTRWTPQEAAQHPFLTGIPSKHLFQSRSRSAPVASGQLIKHQGITEDYDPAFDHSNVAPCHKVNSNLSDSPSVNSHGYHFFEESSYGSREGYRSYTQGDFNVPYGSQKSSTSYSLGECSVPYGSQESNASYALVGGDDLAQQTLSSAGLDSTSPTGCRDNDTPLARLPFTHQLMKQMLKNSPVSILNVGNRGLTGDYESSNANSLGSHEKICVDNMENVASSYDTVVSPFLSPSIPSDCKPQVRSCDEMRAVVPLERTRANSPLTCPAESFDPSMSFLLSCTRVEDISTYMVNPSDWDPDFSDSLESSISTVPNSTTRLAKLDETEFSVVENPGGIESSKNVPLEDRLGP
ncbi:hypothetical protein KP509_11G087000 [Ceratopteris richardii]|uniref:Protein kinase domain-containing protein n=1 Tax=Ceratopteris richardii TaxID=49495 RepID=A0A8T2TRZ7_CERRI|nr:hypothetical protein KP509_11G087000 [Ceratopteris richardii]